jgi:urease accessory protein
MITQKLGNTTWYDVGLRSIDVLEIEWFEANKRIMHKKTTSGRQLVMKFLGEAQSLTEGDVLWQDDTSVVVVGIKPCEAILIRPTSMRQAAAVCYEIGNKHLPLFYYNDEILVPYEAPLYRLLTAAGYAPQKEVRKLLHPLKTTVAPHGHTESRQSLFSKILQLTSPSTDV